MGLMFYLITLFPGLAVICVHVVLIRNPSRTTTVQKIIVVIELRTSHQVNVFYRHLISPYVAL